MFRKIFTAVKEMDPTKRKLVTDSIYGVAEGLAVVGVAAYGAKFSTLEIALVAPAVGMWFGASLHSLYYKVQEYRQNRAERQQENGEENAELVRCVPTMRKSSHEAINSALHGAVSSLFIASDAIYLSGLVPPTITTPSRQILSVRTAASSVWLLSSLMSFISALAIERKEEDNPDKNVRLLGLDSHDVELISESLFLAVGVLYAGAYSSEEPVNPLKVTALALWVLAGVGDVGGLILDAVKRHHQQRDDLAADVEQGGSEEDVIVDMPQYSSGVSAAMFAASTGEPAVQPTITEIEDELELTNSSEIAVKVVG
jgi:hypothetical protein